MHWDINVAASVNGGYRNSKGIMYSLEFTLYRSLSFGKKEQLKLSVRRGKVVFKPSGDNLEALQVQIVDKIVKIVAKDTKVDRISRMVRPNTAVNQCTRGRMRP